MNEFLITREGPRPWTLDHADRYGIRPTEYFLGNGQYAMEVAVAAATAQPSRSDLNAIWKSRQGNQTSPLLLVVLHGDGTDQRASLCGPLGPEPLVFQDLEVSQAERIAAAALDESDRHSAVRLVRASLSEVESELPGIHNVGMFASHELREGLPEHPGWEKARVEGEELLGLRGRDLVQALGFVIEPKGPATSVLRLKEDGTATAIAVFLDESERPEVAGGRFEASPVSTALARAKSENLRFVVLTRGREIRVYGADSSIGVGRKGRAETYIEANLSLLPAEKAGYLPLIFGAGALKKGGTFDEFLEHSRDFASALGARLRDRIYDHVIPNFAAAIAKAHQKAHPHEPIEGILDELYETAMVMLFRLLFIAYGEDKGLLPYEANDLYRRNALKTTARELAERANDVGSIPEFDSEATTLWSQIAALWKAVDRGNIEWGVPLYNGGLFSPDPNVNEAGARLSSYTLTNDEIGQALFHLLIDEGDEGLCGPVDFRALSVREFGTVYEGLLESGLSVAREDLALGEKDLYEPAVMGDAVVVQAGDVYLRNTSGARKAAGSYFTPHFAVEHLLDHALEPALDSHLARLSRLIEEDREAEAAKEFFNFRVADISMGSAHFLVAAVDRIEVRFSDFLERHPLTQVTAELERLRKSATDALGDLAGSIAIERASLLRRQIARRCIYGVDVNHVAVELARLSIWLHTFVPGLPLSFLDRTLVHADSLFGAANAEEAIALLSPHEDKGGVPDLFGDLASRLIADVQGDLEKLAQSSDATEAEIKGAREAFGHIEERLQPLREALDIGVAATVEPELAKEWSVNVDRLLDDKTFRSKHLRAAEPHLLKPRSVHFPLAFPEVFYRKRSGFDCIVGNPPWKKGMQKSDRFWHMYIPGLLGLDQEAKAAAIAGLQKSHPELTELLGRSVANVRRIGAFMNTARFPGMGRSHADLYKAFAWRFLRVVQTNNGALGVVFPRGLFQAAGSADFRKEVLSGTWNVEFSMLENKRGWVFPDVENRFTVALVSISATEPGSGKLASDGPFKSLREFKVASRPPVMQASLVEKWSPDLVIPTIPSSESSDVLDTMMNHPRFGDADRPDFRVRPVQGDFNSSSDKIGPTNRDGVIEVVSSGPRGRRPVLAGEAFDLWTFEPHRTYGWADPQHADRVLFQRRLNQVTNRRSAFYGLPNHVVSDVTTLPSEYPRLAFRKVSRATDSRTMRVGVVPEYRYLTDGAQYLFFLQGDRQVQAYLLGVLASKTFDWMARRYVETNFSFYLLNPLPVPLFAGIMSERVRDLAVDLSSQQEELTTWAAMHGQEIKALTVSEQADREAELDAVVAHLYGLPEEALVHIFETFHANWDHEPHTERSLEHYRTWAARTSEVAS